MSNLPKLSSNLPKLKACGVVFCDIEGTELTQEDKNRLSHPLCAGVILFTRNYQNKAQISALIKNVKAIKTPQLLISVDQEGGRVQRFRNEFLNLPAVGRFSKIYQQSAEQGRAAAEAGGWLMATECLSVGVDFSFAPVLDINYGESEIIADRAFSDNADAVIDLSKSWVKGMHKAGMAAVGKHFPGHGFVAADSHLELPVDSRSMKEISSADLKVFSELITFGLEGIMPAHVVYSEINSSAAGFSSFWLQTVLREELNFKGLIFSDDLSMAGALSAGSPLERASFAVKAGCDILLVCNDSAAADEILTGLENNLSESVTARLETLRAGKLFDQEKLLASAEWQGRKKLISTLI